MLKWKRFPLLEELEDPDDPGGAGGEPPKEPKEPEIPEGYLSKDVLPEDLRERSPAEVKFLLERMTSTLATGNEETRTLREELSALKTRLETPPADPDPDDDVPDEELIVKNPDKAIMRILQRRGFADRFDTVEKRTGEATLTAMSRKIHDFDEYEEDVKKLLDESHSPYDEAHIMGAYRMAKGDRAIAAESKARRAAANVDPPKGGEPPDKTFPELTGLEKEIFDASGLTREKYEALKADDESGIKVPT